MAQLLIDGVPSNLIFPPGVTAMPVEADMFDICTRVAEIDPSLFVVVIDDGSEYCFAIMEHADIERLVFKVKYLDGRVLDKLRMIMALSLNDRIEALEKEQFKMEQAEHEDKLDEMYERIGAPMWADLERCGFIQRPVSYHKSYVKQKAGRGILDDAV